MPAPAEAAWDGLPPGHGFTCVFDLDKGWKGDIKIQRGERCRVMQLDNPKPNYVILFVFSEKEGG